MDNSKHGQVKCLVWDLDDTLWNGTLAESGHVTLKHDALDVVKELDRRGILQSAASRNEESVALSCLDRCGLSEYFLHPQIGWGPKSNSLGQLSNLLNIPLNAFAFVDDQAFERDEVKSQHPDVFCLDGKDLAGLLESPQLTPAVITEDGRLRRVMYRAESHRKEAEAAFSGTPEQFLASLRMVLNIGPATPADLARAEELTLRTHQLNTTGRTYTEEELDRFRQSPDHLLLMAGLEDRYGSYGRVGLVLLECTPAEWNIKLLITSCRVLSRGIGSFLLNYVARMAYQRGVSLIAEFIPTTRNRIMRITYGFANFLEVEQRGELVVLRNDLSRIPDLPAFLTVHSNFDGIESRIADEIPIV